MKLPSIAGILLSVLAAALAVACSGDSSPAEPRVQVLTTLELFADFVRQVGGDRVEVYSLVSSADELQSYQPTPEDIDHMRRAQVILINSSNLDGSLVEVINQYRLGASQLVRLAQNVPSPSQAEPGQIHPTAEEAGDNPYLWLDLDAAKIYAASVADSLVIVDGAHADFYLDSGRAYEAALDELDQQLKKKVDSIPPERRRLVTLRDAFPHLARHFGLEVTGVVQPDPAQEPTSAEVSRLAATMKQQGLRAAFQDSQADSPAMEQLKREAGVKLCKLYSDRLDEDVRSFKELIRFDVEELARCL
ncbi:MAG: zinc ABC transporter substrate-binding protein [Chloroflexi bacterium]|nr:zinc ABC transporter substrate-binding protein [Chloroflexota bacterium]